MMNSFFNTSVDMKDILFKGWDTSSTKGAILASFIALVLAALFEGAKVIKAYIVIRREQSPLTYGRYHTAQHPGDAQLKQDSPSSFSSVADLLSPLKIPASIEQIRQWRIKLFVLESITETFNFFFGYILMLLVMSYSVWFLVAVIIGSGVGFFLLNPVRAMYADKYSNDKQSEAEREIQGAPSNSFQAAINSNQGQEETSRIQQPTRNYESVARKGK